MRSAKIVRKTKETSIELSLNIDGGDIAIDTGIGFFDHMLELFAFHGGFGLSLKAKGDINVDGHHTVEDAGIAFGEAFYSALGDKVGISRYAQTLLPMDETLAESAVDISGRAALVFNVAFPPGSAGFDMELVEEFFRAFAANAKITLHINLRYGKNNHHIAEAVFKSAARSLREAVKITSDALPSTKGCLA
ncbi:MAG: imidazoleglycerol-phosphate dehydratase HisB [Deferribacteraceae bacterium]|nr:imidazoleglycerol-phosphate dehydratase HisB [Deferribacteraceae bacterium]